ncbi:hypothetical protein D9615_002121 [Tricholomella constricta]|uniref:Uncharacterized protein n=1 Tax=Tricholomella constricta TaxID=117010 RepID=A0A8H5HP68_9AGAR|nr:hypothetical protein D9615_002121 [Tricholomella constricta]
MSALGAFQPPPESGLCSSHNNWAGSITLLKSYYQATKDASFINDNWKAAVKQVFCITNEQSQPTFDEDFNFISYYNWTGSHSALFPQVNNRENNEPKAYTGLVGTNHRPLDDLSIFGALRQYLKGFKIHTH